jgi:hypothetical protein
MQLSTDGHPDPDELASLADGEASAEVTTHVHGCAACTERALGYAQAQSRLRRSLYRFDCPDAHTLGEYLIDLLGPAERTAVAAHASECDECSAELQMLRGYLAQPPMILPSLVERARRVVAGLFTPASGLAYEGLRGTADASTRVFVADDVTVTVGPGSGAGTLIGLVMVEGTPPAALAGREVRLVAIDDVVIGTLLDDLGNFEFELVAAGLYALEVDLADAQIVVEEVRVR